MTKLDCLRDCNAACCRMQPFNRIVFDFSETEARMFENQGVQLIPHKDHGYMMPGDCVFLEGNRCSLHGKSTQPQCCVDNRVGGDLCLSVRDAVYNGKRWNEVE